MKTKPDEERQTEKLKSIKDVKPLSNYVLIKPTSDNINRKTKSGIIIVAPAYAEQTEHVDRIGEVIKAPSQLFFNDRREYRTKKVQRTSRRDPDGTFPYETITSKPYKYLKTSMDWDCDIDLQEGDQVLYSYIEGINCCEILYRNGEEEERYLLVPYEEIYAVKRRIFSRDMADANSRKRHYIEEDQRIYEIIPINGWIICAQVKKKKINECDHLSEQQIDKRYAIAKFIGKPVRKYFGLGDLDSKVDIKFNDKLLKEDENIAPTTESYYHAEFFGKREEFIFLQRRHIAAVLN